MFKPEVVREEFSLPDHLVPVNILLVGYGDGEPASPERHAETRKPITETVWYEHF
jgi:nitroreductase